MVTRPTLMTDWTEPGRFTITMERGFGAGAGGVDGAASPVAFHPPNAFVIVAFAEARSKSPTTTRRARSGRKRRAYSRFRISGVRALSASAVGDTVWYGW